MGKTKAEILLRGLEVYGRTWVHLGSVRSVGQTKQAVAPYTLILCAPCVPFQHLTLPSPGPLETVYVLTLRTELKG